MATKTSSAAGTAKSPACSRCAFWSPAPAKRVEELGDEHGACRRYPDAIGKLPHDWCGEFKSES